MLFRRGDLFRGAIQGRSGVTYGAWGSGPRPTICASRRNYADPSLWRQTDETNVWRCTERLHNVGIVLFDHDPQVLGAFDRRFALMRLPKRNEPFDKPVQLDADLTFRNVFHDDRLELRSDHGNPGVRFSRIEIGEHGHCLWLKGDGIAVEDLHLTLSGSHGVGGSGMRRDITVRNCVIDWLGGSIIEGWKFGTARFGNGVEIWGGCDGFRVEGNWIYQIYDTGATIQCNDRNDFVCRMANVEFVSNRIENCFWALEYYNARNAAGSSVDNVRFAHNVCLRTGRGWGCVGRESQAPVLAIGVTPPSTTRFAVEKNVFDGSTGPLIACSEDAPQGAFSLRGNIYRQHEGGVLERMRYRLPPSSLSADPSSEEYRRQFSDKMFSSDAAAYLAQRYGDAAGRVETLGIRRGDRVVILGDSLTNQGLAVRDGGYWHRLTNGIARVHGDGYAAVIPLGFSGWQLPAWIDTERKTRSKGFRYDTCGKFWDVKDVFDGGADIVAVFIGMNDILRPVVSADAASLDAWIAQYRSFISTLRSRLKARRVLLATISPLTCDPQARKNEVRRELNARIRALAFEAGCGVIEIDRVLDPLNDEARRLWKSHLAGDFVHPSWGLGHAGIAQAFAEALGEREMSAAFAEDVRDEANRLLARADALSVNQTPLMASFAPDASDFDYEISWHLKRGFKGGEVSIELPQGWRVVATNSVSAVPNAFEPRFFDGERGYFVVRGSPQRITTPISVAVRTAKGGMLRKTVQVPSPWRARNNGGEWRLLSPSWDYCGWGSPWNVEPFQSFFGGTDDTLVAFRRIWSPRGRKAQIRLSTRTFSARLDIKVRLNGAFVGERRLRSSKEKCKGAPMAVELREGWNTLEVECRHDRSQRQFLCELTEVGGDRLDDLRYDWRMGDSAMRRSPRL